MGRFTPEHLLPFQQAQYLQWEAKRRIVSFGGRYDFAHHELLPAAAVPEFLHPLRRKLAHLAGIEAAEFSHGLIAEYQPGTQLGWHRDVPDGHYRNSYPDRPPIRRVT